MRYKHKQAMKYSFIILSFLLSNIGYSQVGAGFVGSLDLYQRYVNPDDGISDPSHGNAMLNLSLGPKLWLGGKKMSFSVEGQANVGFTGFTLGENKGLGALSFPIVGSLNFNGLSGFDREGKLGLTIGGGVQYNKTEIFGLKEEFVDKGVTRDYFQTIIIQAGYGFGISGFNMLGLVRYGFNPDDTSSSLNIGLQFDLNVPMMKKINDPNSAL